MNNKEFIKSLEEELAEKKLSLTIAQKEVKTLTECISTLTEAIKLLKEALPKSSKKPVTKLKE